MKYLFDNKLTNLIVSKALGWRSWLFLISAIVLLSLFNYYPLW